MAVERYPRYVHQGDKSFKVMNSEEHAARFPDDHKTLMGQIENESKSDSTITVLEAKERERCAQIAEHFQRGDKMGNKIAAAIRASGPSSEKLAKLELVAPAEPPPAPIVPPVGPSGESTIPPAPIKGYPKLLRNPVSVRMVDATHTVEQAGGLFSQPDKLVNTPNEETAARASGFIIEVPPPALA